jgi:hypothetical protein
MTVNRRFTPPGKTHVQRESKIENKGRRLQSSFAYIVTQFYKGSTMGRFKNMCIRKHVAKERPQKNGVLGPRIIIPTKRGSRAFNQSR